MVVLQSSTFYYLISCHTFLFNVCYENVVVYQTICALPCKMMIRVTLISSLPGMVLVLCDEI